MTSAGAIKFYANHLYPGRCPLRSSRFSTPTFRSVNHFSHPFFSETKTQKTSRNFQRIRVNPHSSHVHMYISRSLFFSFLHSTPHTLWQDKKMEEGNEKGWSSRSLEGELSKKKARNWIHFVDGFKFDERLERELTNNFAFSSDNLNPFKGGSLEIREGIGM